jgi:hypothetical protein
VYQLIGGMQPRQLKYVRRSCSIHPGLKPQFVLQQLIQQQRMILHQTLFNTHRIRHVHISPTAYKGHLHMQLQLLRVQRDKEQHATTVVAR